MSETVIAPDTTNPASTILELDELWSFVMKKTNQAWIWIALCRQTRQVVAYAIGDRSQATCRCLWEAIPPVYRAGLGFTDFWSAYRAVIPEEQHTAVGKETGETAPAHVDVGIIRSDSAWLALSAKRCPSPNRWGCTMLV